MNFTEEKRLRTMQRPKIEISETAVFEVDGRLLFYTQAPGCYLQSPSF